MFDKESIYFVTSRTFQGRYLMQPTEEVQELIGGLLARATRKYSIQLFGYVFMSNHFHLLIQGEPARIPRFVGWLKREISVRLGRKQRNWTGGFWGRRYDAEEVLDDDALEEKLRYIASHGVKERLVARSTEWPGLHCIHQIGTDDPIEFELEIGNRKVLEQLRLARLPRWKELSATEFCEVAGALKRDMELIGETLLVSQKKPPSLETLLERPFDFRPAPPPPKPRKRCHTKFKRLQEAFDRKFAQFHERFAVASAEYRAGNLTVAFPEGAFRPPLPPTGSHLVSTT